MSDSGAISRCDAEDFLYYEAELLDDWRLLEWKDLYARDSAYEIVSTDCDDPGNADPTTSLFLLADKKNRIDARANRLMKRSAHAEYPHSRTRHLYTNVRIVDSDKGQTKLKANFLVFRTGEDRTTEFMGEMHYTLVREDNAIKVRSKRLVLDLNSLNAAGQMTIIL
jgi:p-cumate 2,3-dioxygenase subunit beta